MNEDLSFSDTFDNVTFSNSGKLFAKYEPRGVFKDVAPELNNSFAPTNISISDSIVCLKENVSLDDSMFFAESFTSLKSKDINRSSKIDSEDLFSDSDSSSENILNKPTIGQSTVLDVNLDKEKQIIQVQHSFSQPVREPDVTLGIDELDAEHNEMSKESNKCNLAAWNLPEMILRKYESHNIKSMFVWQSDCLNSANVLGKRKNLVYSAPTTAGKTLVAEILAIKTVFEHQKKVLFILPFVSVVREKMLYFQDLLNTSGVRVEGFMGSYNPPGGFHSVQVAICTIEKANSLVNRLLEENTISDLGAVIVDEIHLLGDSSRGYLLELLLTKLRYMSIKDDNINIQIIGMSATLPNLDLLAKWLDAELYTTTFRPIPLYELCHINGEIYNDKLEFQRKLPALPDIETDTDNILQLCLETIENSCSVLIFCPTKNWCENLAQQIASAFWKLGTSKSTLGDSLRHQLKTDLITELLAQLKRCPVGLDKVLGKTASFGVAFHHAGLTMDERDIIEGAFRSNVLRVLVATSTLSSGVNLPARRVIIRSPMFNGKPINVLTYKQMIGRAGRMGKDIAGDSILICQKGDYKIVKELLSANLERIESCLEGAGKLKRAILEVIASGVATSPDDVKLFTNCTLLAVDSKRNTLSNPIEEAIEFLENNEFMRLLILEGGTRKYVATSLAKACLSSSLPPEEGITLFTELEKARQCFVLETELHLIYLVTPYSACNHWSSIDWMFYLELWEKLPSSMKRVGELVGVRESYIISATRGKIQTTTSHAYHKLQVHKRFYTALALQELVNEVSLNDVATKFNCSRGMLQSLQQNAATFAGMVTSFSKQLGWSSVEILISQFQGRLHFGVNRDLLDLMRLPLLNGPRARTLYNNGIETLVQLASSDPYIIEKILHKVAPFETGKEREGETEYEAQKRNKIRTVWITGKQGLTEGEAAAMLVSDARQFLKFEIGLTEAKWENAENIKEDTIELDNPTKLNAELKSNLLGSQVLTESKSENVDANLIRGTQFDGFLVSRCDEEKGDNNGIHCRESNFLNSSKKIDTNSKPDLSLNKILLETNSLPNSTRLVQAQNSVTNEATQRDEFQVSVSNTSTETNPSSLSINLRSKGEKENCKIGTCEFNWSNESLFFSSFKYESPLKSSANIQESNKIVNDKSDLKKNLNSVTSVENIFSTNIGLDASNSSSSTSKDFVATSQSQADSVSYSTLNLLSSAKKRCRYSDKHRNSSSADEQLIRGTPQKKRKLCKTKTKLTNSDFMYIVSQDRSKPDTIPCKLPHKIPVDLTNFEIINVSDNSEVFDCFCDEMLSQNEISLSLACSHFSKEKKVIGTNIIARTPGNKKNTDFVCESMQAEGLSVTWGGSTAYYVSFQTSRADTAIKVLQSLLKKTTSKVKIFDCKEQIKALKLCCNIDFECVPEDPKIGDWLLEPDGKEKNLLAMALKYSPEAVGMVQLAGSCKGVGSVGLNLRSTIEPRIRSSIEAIATWHLLQSMQNVLAEQDMKLLHVYGE